MSKEGWLEHKLNRLTAECGKQRTYLLHLENDIRYRIDKAASTTTRLEKLADEVKILYRELREQETKQMAKERASWKATLAQVEVIEEVENPDLSKASTIAIFDSILFAIENWSSNGDTAPDFSLACQAVLFPLVYEKVMAGNEDYILKTVPFSAMEVVKRGREYVQHLRAQHPAALTDTAVWKLNIDMISEWWRNDALPLIYGARDDAWDRSSTLSLEDIIVWRDQPASRALQFPMVFDAMDLVDRFGDSIRDTTGLPEFTRQTIDTRLEVN